MTSFSFENGRRPNLKKRKITSILFWQPRKLIFGKQPYVNPTKWNMEDDLSFLENGRQPQIIS